MPNAPIFGSGNRQDPWQIRASELINWLYYNKQAVLVEGSNITLTPRQDGTVEISASGGEGTVTDVLVDGVSVVNQDGEAELATMTGATSQAAGEGGFVPAPAIADRNKYLKGDGTWGEVSTVGDLDDLGDVNITDPTDGEALIYDATNDEWVNGEVGGAVDDVVMNGQSIVTNKVANFRNYVELTQSEYDALPASKLTDGILYCIKDTGIVEGEKFAPVIYSLEEREIGVWTDGKPLYQKTVTGTFSSSATDLTIDYSDLNIQKLVCIYGILNPDNSVYSKIIGFGDPGYSLVFYSVSVTNCVVRRGNRGWWGNTPTAMVTIQYTKTTDVPGSGKWTTQGVPAWKNYHANWIATSSSATGTNLTEEVTIPAGKYLIICHTPVTNYSTPVLNNDFQFGIKVNGVLDLTTIAITNRQYGNFSVYLEISEQSTISLCTAMSTSITWESAYIDRGGMDILC